MGNVNTKTLHINNSSMSSKSGTSFLNSLGCNILKSKKKKSEMHYKTKSVSVDVNDKITSLNTISSNQKNPTCAVKILRVNNDVGNLYKNESKDISSNNNEKSDSIEETGCNMFSSTQRLVGVNDKNNRDSSLSALDGFEESNKDQTLRSYPQHSESSLNSDDLMLGTDVNLDQADDDVSKDYNTNEKDDPFINTSIVTVREQVNSVNSSSVVLNNSMDTCADEAEKNDIVSFDSSTESSASAQRKILGKGFILRPHSFSSPLRPNARDGKPLAHRNSNLSTVDSIDLAWTWISASETANLSQDVSNLKLMLLKMRRLLLDEASNDPFNIASRNEVLSTFVAGSSVFSEPSTPICYTATPNCFQPDSDIPQIKQWETLSKETLIQEIHDLRRQNGELQYQLKEKCRIIELLQDQHQNHRNCLRRMHSTSFKGESYGRKINRNSSTFETASSFNNNSLSQDSDCPLATGCQE